MSRTVLDHLKEHAEQIGDRPAYGEKLADPEASGAARSGTWQTTSWGEYYAQIRQCGRALMHLGLAEQGRAAILGNNHPEWAIFCLGTMAARAVPVGIYQTCSSEQVAYILRHAEASVALVENEAQWRKVEAVWQELPDLRCVVVMRSGTATDDAWFPDNEDGNRPVLRWQEFLALGNEVEEAELNARLSALMPEDTATFIYTSGTTGRPKAVMLSHGNILETGRIGNVLHSLSCDDSLICYLPMAHVAEQMMSVHMPAYVGYTVYYVEAPEQLLDNLVELQPTIFFAVPRVWERFYVGISDKLSRAPWHLRAALGVSQKWGRACSEALGRDRGPGLLDRLGWTVADRLLVRKLRRRLGLGNVQVAASGAAPIRREILDFFSGLGVRIYEVYGLSETCGPGTWNRAGNTRLGTVGPVIPEVEIRLAEDGEILFRGPNVFQGYFKDEAGTAEVLDDDGWFHTGDLGRLDEDGFLTITGRKKEIIITSGGKNIAPASIEGKLEDLELVGDAMVVGDDQRFLVVLLSLESEAAQRFAEERGLTRDPETDLSAEPAVLEELRHGIRRVNRQLARVEAVRNFRVLPRRLSTEAGELTPTLKMKRGVVAQRYADEIESMYAEGQAIRPDPS